MFTRKVFINIPETTEAFDVNVEYIQGATTVLTEYGVFTKKLIDIMKDVYNDLNIKTLTISVIQYFFKHWNKSLLKSMSKEYILNKLKKSDKYKEALAIVTIKKELKQLKREISVAKTFQEIETAIERYKAFNKKTFEPEQNDLILIGD